MFKEASDNANFEELNLLTTNMNQRLSNSAGFNQKAIVKIILCVKGHFNKVALTNIKKLLN